MGGDHKCPLCSATFTRPQHVGRHLRAHTGDRPYDCKECPLRFARSDLLSRHVNKAHRPPEEGAEPSKRGRRKSMGSAPDGEPLLAKSSDKARASSFVAANNPFTGDSYAFQRPATSGAPVQHPPPHQGRPQTATKGSLPLPAHTIYPHHPLLTNTPQASISASMSNAPISVPSAAWTMPAAPVRVNPGIPPNFTNPFSSSSSLPSSANMGMPNLSNVFDVGSFGQSIGAGSGGQALGTGIGSSAMDMRYSASNQGPMGVMNGNVLQQAQQAFNGFPLGYEYGYKKKACDQCNHSKVRCDFADPCIRCVNKNMPCSYNKPAKSRSMVVPIPYMSAAQRLSLPNFNPSSATYMTDLAPDAAYPHLQNQSGQVGATPLMTHSMSYGYAPPSATAAPTAGQGQQLGQGEVRRRSFSSLPPQFYPAVRPDMPTNSYTQMFGPDQSWQHAMGADTSPTGNSSGLSAVNIYAPNMSIAATQHSYGTPQSIESAGSGQSLAPQAMHAVPLPPLPGGQIQPLPQQQQQQQQLYQPQLPMTNIASRTSPVATIGPRAPAPAPAPNPAVMTSTSMKAENSTSPPVARTNTPALTSHSTSPSGPDEPPEQRGSLTGSYTGWIMPPHLSAGGTGKGSEQTRPMPPEQSSDPNLFQPSNYSPVSISATTQVSPDAHGTYSATTASPNFFINMGVNGNFAWPPALSSAGPAGSSASIAPEVSPDSRLHLRSAAAPGPGEGDEDGTTSQAESSHRSSLFDLEEGLQTLQNRRRSSTTGVWASAFNDMTLQDPAGNTIPLSAALGDPFTAAQLAATLQSAQVAPMSATGTGTEGQLILPKRTSLPSEPISIAIPSAVAALSAQPVRPGDLSRLGSTSDVRDLWKLFMLDPLTGATPSKEKMTSMDFGGAGPSAQITPRPNMGHRTLSKSSSMPDLTSPTLINQAFFANFGNGVTPGADAQDPAQEEQGRGGQSAQKRLDATGESAGSSGQSDQPGSTHALGAGVGANSGSTGADRNGDAQAIIPVPTTEDAQNLRKWKNEIQQRQTAFTMSMSLQPQPAWAKKVSLPPQQQQQVAMGAGTGGAAAGEMDYFQVNSLVGMGDLGDFGGLDVNALAQMADMGDIGDFSADAGLGPQGRGHHRPIASVLQHNAALNMTLAPERVPSFGTAPPSASGSSFPSSSRAHAQAQITAPSVQQANKAVAVPALPAPAPPPRTSTVRIAEGAKTTSMMARPGNKRLASQTLVSGEDKKFSVGDGDEDEDEDEEGQGEGDEGDEGDEGGEGGGEDVDVEEDGDEGEEEDMVEASKRVQATLSGSESTSAAVTSRSIPSSSILAKAKLGAGGTTLPAHSHSQSQSQSQPVSNSQPQGLAYPHPNQPPVGIPMTIPSAQLKKRTGMAA